MEHDSEPRIWNSFIWLAAQETSRRPTFSLINLEVANTDSWVLKAQWTKIWKVQRNVHRLSHRDTKTDTRPYTFKWLMQSSPKQLLGQLSKHHSKPNTCILFLVNLKMRDIKRLSESLAFAKIIDSALWQTGAKQSSTSDVYKMHTGTIYFSLFSSGNISVYDL